ncbi:MAG: hypothetical protein RR822_05850, partial [Raoultibacter sp.]
KGNGMSNSKMHTVTINMGQASGSYEVSPSTLKQVMDLVAEDGAEETSSKISMRTPLPISWPF